MLKQYVLSYWFLDNMDNVVCNAFCQKHWHFTVALLSYINVNYLLFIHSVFTYCTLFLFRHLTHLSVHPVLYWLNFQTLERHKIIAHFLLSWLALQSYLSLSWWWWWWMGWLWWWQVDRGCWTPARRIPLMLWPAWHSSSVKISPTVHRFCWNAFR